MIYTGPLGHVVYFGLEPWVSRGAIIQAIVNKIVGLVSIFMYILILAISA